MVNKRFIINLASILFAFILNVGLSFILAPYIVGKLGIASYGFVELTTTFVGYIGIATAALNALAGRYIAIAYHKKHFKQASVYFSSVLVANVLLSLVVLIIGLFVSGGIGIIFNTEGVDLLDVKIAFFLSFLGFIVGLINTVFIVSTFVVNRLDVDSMRKMIGSVIRVIVTIALFTLFAPQIYYIPLAALLAALILLVWNVNLTKKMLPEVSIRFDLFKVSYIKKIMKNGIWMSVNALSALLLTGMDLILANVFLGATQMGILSVAKVAPTAIYMLSTYVASVFSPVYTKLYALKKKDDLVSTIKMSVRVLAVVMTPPIVAFIIFGREFYSLWQPALSSDVIETIYVLSILTLIPIVFNSVLEGLYFINILANKIKVSVLVTLGMGVANLVTVLVLLSATDLGLYAIAGVSSLFLLARVLIFTPIFCAYILGIKKTTFYPTILKVTSLIVFLVVIFMVIKNFFLVDSWISFALIVGVSCIIAYCVAFLYMIKKSELSKVMNYIKRSKK